MGFGKVDCALLHEGRSVPWLHGSRPVASHLQVTVLGGSHNHSASGSSPLSTGLFCVFHGLGMMAYEPPLELLSQS